MVKVEKLADSQRLVNENTNEGFLIVAITLKKRYITVDEIKYCKRQNKPLRLSSSKFLTKFKDFKVYKVAEEKNTNLCDGCPLKKTGSINSKEICKVVPFCQGIILKEVK